MKLSLSTVLFGILLIFGVSQTASATTEDKASGTTNAEVNASGIYDAKIFNGFLIDNGQQNALSPKPDRRCVEVCIPFTDICKEVCIEDFIPF